MLSPGGRDGRCSSAAGRDFEAIWNVFTGSTHQHGVHPTKKVQGVFVETPPALKEKEEGVRRELLCWFCQGTPWAVRLHADCRRPPQLWDGLVAVWRRAGLTKQGKAAEEMKAVQTQRVRNKTSPCGKGHAWKIFGPCTPGLDVCSPRRGHGKPSPLRTDLVSPVGRQSHRRGPCEGSCGLCGEDSVRESCVGGSALQRGCFLGSDPSITTTAGSGTHMDRGANGSAREPSCLRACTRD